MARADTSLLRSKGSTAPTIPQLHWILFSSLNTKSFVNAILCAQNIHASSTRGWRPGGVAQELECLPSKYKAKFKPKYFKKKKKKLDPVKQPS
jgi:hypothetical protein